MTTGTKGNGPTHDDLLAEWTAARDVLARIDENLHDLRKYGFGFVTALFGIATFFTEAAEQVPAKLAILIATMALIAALSLVDRNYRVMLGGAANRAKALERRSNRELTWEISRVYNASKVGVFYGWAYGILVGVVGVFGFLVLLESDVLYLAVDVLATVLFATFVYVTETFVRPTPWVYLEADKGAFNQGESAFVVLTNFTHRTLTLDGEVWAIYSEADWATYMRNGQANQARKIKENPRVPVPVQQYLETDAGVVLRHGQDYRWPIRTEKLEGLYRLVYKGRSFWPNPRAAGDGEPNTVDEQKDSAWPFVVVKPGH